MACDAIILKFFRIGEFAAHLNFTRLEKLSLKNLKLQKLNSFWGHVTLWQKLKSAALSFLLKIWETIAGWTEYSFEW
jgi:hypothetical protein